jgi:hypothetical protein
MEQKQDSSKHVQKYFFKNPPTFHGPPKFTKGLWEAIVLHSSHLCKHWLWVGFPGPFLGLEQSSWGWGEEQDGSGWRWVEGPTTKAWPPFPRQGWSWVIFTSCASLYRLKGPKLWQPPAETGL